MTAQEGSPRRGSRPNAEILAALPCLTCGGEGEVDVLSPFLTTTNGEPVVVQVRCGDCNSTGLHPIFDSLRCKHLRTVTIDISDGSGALEMSGLTDDLCLDCTNVEDKNTGIRDDADAWLGVVKALGWSVLFGFFRGQILIYRANEGPGITINGTDNAALSEAVMAVARERGWTK